MVVDWRADHSFRRPRPDLTAEIGTPNACSQSGCHADKPLAWVLERRTATGTAARRLPHYGTTFAAARAGKPGSRRGAAAHRRQHAAARHRARHGADLPAALSRAETSAAVLRAALTSDEPLLRHVAASAPVGPRPGARVPRTLAPLLSDPVKAVRLDAVSALAGMPGRAAEALPARRAARRHRGVPAGDGLLARLRLVGHEPRQPVLEPRGPRDGRAVLPAGAEGRRPLLPGEDEPRGAAERRRPQRRGRDAVPRGRRRPTPTTTEAAYSLGLLLVGDRASRRRPSSSLRARRARPAATTAARATTSACCCSSSAGSTRPGARSSRRSRSSPRNADFLLALGDHYLQARARAGRGRHRRPPDRRRAGTARRPAVEGRGRTATGLGVVRVIWGSGLVRHIQARERPGHAECDALRPDPVPPLPACWRMPSGRGAARSGPGPRARGRP